MRELIGIDLGSNSLRAARINEKGEVLGIYETTVRTAQGLEETQLIAKEALERILVALEKMKQTLNVTPNDEIVALTTQAMRKAKNQKEILQALAQKSGITFRVISGEEEAFITSLAPKRTLKTLAKQEPKWNQDCFILIDMGGASSEFIFCLGEKICSRSFEIGIVSAKDKYKNLETLRENKTNFLKEILEFIKEAKNKGFEAKFLVANSGTPTTIAAFKLGLIKYDAQKVSGKELTLGDFREQLDKYLALSQKERENRLGEFKADVVPFGVEIFIAFMETLGFQECLVIDEGIREGAVMARLLGYI